MVLVITESGAASFYNKESTVVSVKASGVKSINKKADKVVALISDDRSQNKTCVTSEAPIMIIKSYFEATARLGRLQHVMRTF